MEILCIIPPHIPSYFNAGHHLPIFQVAAFLRNNDSSLAVKTLDAAVLNIGWKNICEYLVNSNFDIIFAMNDFDGIDTFERFVHYCRKLSPNSKLVTFGRLSKQNPRIFRNFKFDAIHCSGDYESGAYDYVQYLKGVTGLPPGMLMKSMETYIPTGTGRVLEPEEWVFPQVQEIPYESYDKMYGNDFNKYCGIPNRRELVVPIARGCPIGCSYCDVPTMQGKKERRTGVEFTLDYIQRSFANNPFEYISFYAPTFTLDQKWVYELCHAMVDRKITYPWKCVTTLSLLNESIISLMARSGCIRISVGVETIEEHVALDNLPKHKSDGFSKLKEISRLSQRHKVELNCFIIMGLPGDTIEGLEKTMDFVHKNNSRARPTIYTNYSEITDNMDLSDVGLYNRQLFANKTYGCDIEAQYYRLFHGNEYRKDTSVHEAIPENILSYEE